MVQPSQKLLPSIFDHLIQTTTSTSIQLAPLAVQNLVGKPFLDYLKELLAEKKFEMQLAEYVQVIEKLVLSPILLNVQEGFSLSQLFTHDSVVQLNGYFQKLFCQNSAEKAERALHIALYYDLLRCVGQKVYACLEKNWAQDLLLRYLENEERPSDYSLIQSAISSLVSDEMQTEAYRDSVVATQVDTAVAIAFVEMKLAALRERAKNFVQKFCEPRKKAELFRLYLFSQKLSPKFMKIYAISHNGYCIDKLYELAPAAQLRLENSMFAKIIPSDATALYEGAIAALDPQHPQYYCLNLDQEALEIYPPVGKRKKAQGLSSLVEILHEKSEESFACRRIYQKVGQEVSLSVLKVPELMDALTAAFTAANGHWNFDFNAETISKVKKHLIQTILINFKSELRVRGAIFLDILDYFQAYTDDALQGLNEARGAIYCASEINRRLTTKKGPCIPEEQQLCHGVIEETVSKRVSRIFVLTKMIELLHRAKFLERYLTQVALEPKVVPFYFIAQDSVFILNAYYNGKTFAGLLNDKTGGSEKRLEVLVGKVTTVSQHGLKVAKLTSMQLVILQEKAPRTEKLEFLALSQNLISLSQYILEGKNKRGRSAKDLQRESPLNHFDQSDIWLQVMKYNLNVKI